MVIERLSHRYRRDVINIDLKDPSFINFELNLIQKLSLVMEKGTQINFTAPLTIWYCERQFSIFKHHQILFSSLQRCNNFKIFSDTQHQLSFLLKETPLNVPFKIVNKLIFEHIELQYIQHLLKQMIEPSCRILSVHLLKKDA